MIVGIMGFADHSNPLRFMFLFLVVVGAMLAAKILLD